MRIAVVGSGVAGLTAAYALSSAHAVTLYEAADRLGGHAHTQEVRLGERTLPVDTGFLVYNERTYPNFTRLLAELGVATQPSEMSFSVRDESSGLEYNGHSLNTVFAQRRNLARPAFWRLLGDIVRFNRAARRLAAAGDDRWSLGEFIDRGRYGRLFPTHYLLPMAGAIWSCDPLQVREFPALFLARFFCNHGLLDLRDRPQWRTIVGGSREYVARLAARLGPHVRLAARVERVERTANGVVVQTQRGARDAHDWIVLALHSDQALRVLAEPTPSERAVLSALRYQRSEAVLHTDERFLPRLGAVRASWNYCIGRTPHQGPTVTYWLNRLQDLPGPVQLCVTLNQSDRIAPERVLARMTYEHPVFDRASEVARGRWSEINGRARTSFCGAYWRYGFHEDGVVSAVRVCRALGVHPAFAGQDAVAEATSGRPVAPRRGVAEVAS